MKPFFNVLRARFTKQGKLELKKKKEKSANGSGQF